MPHIIVCRAKVVSSCMDGQPTAAQFGDDWPLNEDGTYLWDQDGGSLVCDACYIALGAPLNEDLPAILAAAKGRLP